MQNLKSESTKLKLIKYLPFRPGFFYLLFNGFFQKIDAGSVEKIIIIKLAILILFVQKFIQKWGRSGKIKKKVSKK